ncbi:protein piccolo-like isoform X3 [Poecilia formosa]|uniref:protein piccolo-like isoform X3 n=1 Tax=Poecilia formosa TaxID=48698 RepID=UPI0007B88411|nr:PREDICTED: protein piccolo-like isoform X3 [Poecilia formosa]
MDPYDQLDLDLECEDGGSVAHKAMLFGGVFRKSSKTAQPSAKAQEASISSHHPELSASSDSLTDNKSSKDKSGMFGGILKRSPRLGHTRRPSQDLLDFPSCDENHSETTNMKDGLSVNVELSASSDSLTESSSSKEKGGMFKGMFKKTNKSAKDDEPQDVSISSQHPELSASSDSLTENKPSKDKSGIFGGILKRSPRPGHTRRPSQDLLDFSADDENTNTKEAAGKVKKSPKFNGMRAASKEDLSGQSELSKSNDSLSKTKESSGFGAIFKNPFGARAPSQEDLTAASEVSESSENLSENHTKEKGFFGGMFKKKVTRSQSQDDLSVDEELSASNDNLSEKPSKGGVVAKILKNPFTSSAQEKEKSENVGDPDETSSAAPKPKTKKSGFSAVMKSTFYSEKQEKSSEADDEETAEGDGDSQHSRKQSKLVGAMTKLNPFRAAAQKEKQTGSDDEEQTVSSEKSSTHKQSSMVEAMNKLNPFRSAAKKDTEDTETSAENGKQSENKADLVKSNLIQTERKEKGENPPVLRRQRAEAMRTTSMHEMEKPKPEEKKEKLPREKKGKSSDPPVVPPRPSEEEMSKTVRHRKKDKQEQSQSGDEANGEESNGTKDKPAKAGSDDEGLKDEESLPKEEDKDEDKEKPEKSKVKKPKKPNPFMPRVKAASDDEGLKDEEEEIKEVEEEKPEKPKVKKTKQQNPFLSRFKGASDDEGLKDEDESSSKEETKDNNKENLEMPKVRKQKHNPFMHRPKAASDDEGLKDEEESSIKEEIKEDGDKENMDKPKVKKPKKHNPFMPRIKARVIQKNRPDGAAAENEEPQRSLFDRLEDLRMEPSGPEDGQDVEDLMDWWNTVEPWEDTPQDDDMTEKEEAKAFAVTADKVQKGIRVFNKLFSERAESLWQHVIDLNAIADGLDKFNKKTKIAQITGGSTSAIGGVATITGLALAPVTMGTSLIITAVGLGVATAGGLTSAGAGISNQVNNSLDRKKVEKIVEDYQEKIADLNKCLKFIKQGIENLRKFDLIKMKKSAYNQDFPALTSQFYEDGAMAGKAILINANEIMRVVQIANVAGSTAARAVQIASMATGVLTGLFVGMDIYFVAKDSKELKKGAKSEFAAKIREVATQLHDGLVELNTIREELHSTTPEGIADGKEGESEKKETSEKHDESSDEDEIDRIKKAIKKDLESREYV